jgi:uncharacterized protein YxjI
MVSLDIVKAYDTVWKHRVHPTLHKMNFKGNILKMEFQMQHSKNGISDATF